MKKTLKKIIMVMLTAIAACLLFAACGDGDGEKKYDHLVTFDYNVGELGEGFENQYLGVMDGSVVAIKPGYSDAYKEATLKGYYIEGWYTAKTDGDGNPIVGEDGRVVLASKWDFERNTVSENITLYANFVQQASLVITGGDADKVFTGLPGETRKEPSSSLAPKKNGWTLIGYYTDEAYTTEFTWPYTFEAGVTTTVYARFMEGEWSLVSTAVDFSNALKGGKNIYLMADIDFSETTKWPAGISYGGEIAGNGHKLTGIDIGLTVDMKTRENFGIFGTLASTANLHDLTIETAKVSFTDDLGFPDLKVALLAWKAEAGVKLTNVTVSGTLTQARVHTNTDVTYYATIAIDEGAVIDSTCDFTQITIPTNENE